ncbi:hypothetical protein [Roseobacter sinensis]|uniref:Uncharacterized protein n=1 Tax=Roseobacter sinensis TaxID=2931391 RepID=A0ABT3BI28_9RHOB|nr:hypothetical protein [Roseobacter sp. WL0113]MCV3273222.1 hypothetical protein [Roseobacter sp. WL0113]
MANSPQTWKRAVPVREGVGYVDGARVIAWREYRWNTGEISRIWFLDATDLDHRMIDIVEIATHPGSDDTGL